MSAFERQLVKALEALPHAGWSPMHLGIFHWVKGVLTELRPADRPPQVVEAFRNLHEKFFPRDQSPV